MTGQKQRIIKRFEREAKKKYKKMKEAGIVITCLCDKPKWHLVNFSVDEIEKIILHKDEDETGGMCEFPNSPLKITGGKE